MSRKRNRFAWRMPTMPESVTVADAAIEKKAIDQTQDISAAGEEPPAEKQAAPADDRPLGAQALAAVHERLQAMTAELAALLPQLEQEKVKGHLETLAGDLKKMAAEAMKVHRVVYEGEEDVPPPPAEEEEVPADDKGAEETDAEEAPEDDDDDRDEDELAKAATVRRKAMKLKAAHDDELANCCKAMQDAGEFLEEHAGTAALSRTEKSACLHHGKALLGSHGVLSKAMAPDDDDDDTPDDDDEAKTLNLLAAKLETLAAAEAKLDGFNRRVLGRVD